jgi:hypothetical protein
MVGTITLLGVMWFAAILYLFTGVHPYKIDPVYSPDNSKVAIPSVSYNKHDHDTYLLIYIEIKDTNSEEVLFQILTRASDRMRWSVEWIDNSRIKLDSSDIGFYCWGEVDGTAWKEIKCP